MTHGSLFSGIGGIDLGFEMAGIETAWTCDVDDWCNKLLEERFPNAKNFKNIYDVNKNTAKRVDIISGGFPCQDVSQAGKGAGLDGKRSGLWFEMFRIIGELRPKWVLIENVANLLNNGGIRVLQDLAEIGYDAEWQVISARDVGARHLRKRLWIIAYSREVSDTYCNQYYGRTIGKSGKKSIGWLPTKKEKQTPHDLWSKTPGCVNVSGKRKTELSYSVGNRCDNATLSTKESDDRVCKEKAVSGNGSDKSLGNVSRKDGRRNKGKSAREDRFTKFKIRTFEGLKNEPRLDRVAYGLSQKVDKYNDRVKGLGNAVLPQIPYLIGRRILKVNNLLEE